MIIGIDLGTTNSLAAVWRDGRSELIPNALGTVLTPSAVGLADDGRVLTGMAARERLSTHPDRTAAAFKRAMGTSHQFRLGDRSFRAEELSAFVLSALKTDAEAHLGGTVTEAVITVPAYFSEAQRKATKAAGKLAGIEVRRLVNEPTAAALAFGMHQAEVEGSVLVLDLGGGTFDVSVLEMFDGVMEVRATAGDNVLGGEDFASVLMDGFLMAVGQEANIPPRSRVHEAHPALRRSAEVVKRALTDHEERDMVLVHGGRELRWRVTRDAFETASAPLLARLRAPIERALRDARLDPAQVGRLVFAGGGTRMPVFRRMATRMLQRFPEAGLNPDEVVALGAGVQAGLLARDAALEDRVMTDVAPFTMGIETTQGQDGHILATGLYLPVIERNTAIPASRSVRVRTLHDKQKQVEIRVFQGEARLIAGNIPLGTLTIDVPPGRAGQHAIDIRFTYDTSGLLEVEAHVPDSGQTRQLVVENGAGILSPTEISERLAKLAFLKIHPREEAENRAVMARAERLYSERLGEERSVIAVRLDAFRHLLNGQDPVVIAAARAELSNWLDAVDTTFFR